MFIKANLLYTIREYLYAILTAIIVCESVNTESSNYAASLTPFPKNEHRTLQLTSSALEADGGAYGKSSVDATITETRSTINPNEKRFIGSSSTRNMIIPFSQYQQRIRQKEKPDAEYKQLDYNKIKKNSVNVKNGMKNGDDEILPNNFEKDFDDSLTPRIIYLPSMQNASTSSQAFENEIDENNSRPRNPIRAQAHRHLSSPNEDSSLRTHNERKLTYYSTASSREPLQFQKSVFRSKLLPSGDSNLLANSGTSGPFSSIYGSTGTSSASGTSRIPLNTMFRPSPSLSSHAAHSTSRYSELKENSRSHSHIPEESYTRRIVPAPYPKLSATGSDNNIVNSIFSQSQSQIRHAPQSFGTAISPVNSFAPPLTGSPFDLFGASSASGVNSGMSAANGLNSLMASLTGGTNNGMGGSAAANPLAGLNPLQLLGQGSTLEQISRIAKNLLSTAASNGAANGGGGNGELLSALTRAIGAGGSADVAKLTSTAVSQPATKNAAVATVATKNVGALIDDINATSTDENIVFNRTGTENVSLKENNNKTSDNSLSLLNELPLEQRQLLEAAIKNGELDVSTLTPSINELFKKSNNNSNNSNVSGIIHGENKLMEWIQQNRPRPSEKEARMNSFVITAADRLPYYGRYCGSFVEHQEGSKSYSVAGAVWATDNRHFIISKFNFRPSSRSVNITFWGGPANITGTPADVFPSSNGFYLRPKMLNIEKFAAQDVQKIPAKTRKIFTAKDVENANLYNKDIPTAAEAEEVDLENASKNVANNTFKKTENIAENKIHRIRRNLYEDLYRTAIPSAYGPMQYSSAMPVQTSTSSSIRFTIQPSLLLTTPKNFSDSIVTTSPYSSTVIPSYSSTTIQSGLPVSSSHSGTNFIIMAAPSTKSTLSQNNPTENYGVEEFSSLDWYANLNPLVLTLPPGRFISDLYWISLFDHNKNHYSSSLGLENFIPIRLSKNFWHPINGEHRQNKKAIAYVLIPNGPGFQVPSVVQLRPLTANAGFNVHSGPIKILDTKTIEVSEFYFENRDVPVWFMVGKDILPNSNGHIVPLYNRTTKAFDCESLRDYDGTETVTLRLPGSLEVRDVFWFAVFSIPRGTSLAHLHLPYNEIHVPPDLDATPTPQCV